jgi:predicted amidophosphoribosyltransferase
VRALKRVRRTSVQATLASDDRARNVTGAFVATRQVAILRGKVAVVVDDVSTTGATLEACRLVLEAAGVREVRTVTAAYTPTHSARLR